MPRNQDNQEAVLLHEIMKAIGAMEGVCVHRNNVGIARHGNARVAYGVGGEGAPDLLCEVRVEYPGGHCWAALWMEVKTASGTVEPHQRAWHATARRNGRDCCVVRSVESAVKAVMRVKAWDLTEYDEYKGQALCKGEV